jgi:hypothetical protein
MQWITPRIAWRTNKTFVKNAGIALGKERIAARTTDRINVKILSTAQKTASMTGKIAAGDGYHRLAGFLP